MTKKLKFPAIGKGTQGDAAKKKSDSGMTDKKGKNKKDSADEKSNMAAVVTKTKTVFGSGRKKMNFTAMIWDSTLVKLRIKLNTEKQLKKLPTKPPKMDSYCVRKYAKESRCIEKTYVISRKVPDNMTAELWIPRNMHLEGDILGRAEEYVCEAKQHGRVITTTPGKLPVKSQALNVVAENNITQTPVKYTTTRHTKQRNALSFWKEENEKRQKLGNFIAAITKRSPEKLSMADHEYEIRRGGEITFSSPSDAWEFERRKTKSMGFWKQQEQMGDGLRGIHVALTRTELGYISEPEIICKAESARGDHTSGSGMLNLCINGQKFSNESSSTLSSKSKHTSSCGTPFDPATDVATLKIQGPALRIAGQTIQWCCGDVGVCVELGVTVYPGQARMENLEIENNGSCVMRFKLVKVHKDDIFNLAAHSVDRIYLDDTSGLLLPRDKRNVSVIFRSKNAGVFSEQWRIVTTPMLGGPEGISLIVWGIAKDRKQVGDAAIAIDQQLEEKVRVNFMNVIFDDILERVCCEPPKINKKLNEYPDNLKHWFSPIFISNELFQACNQGLVYHSGNVAKILNITAVSMPDIKLDKWTLPLDDVRMSVINLPDLVKFHNEMVTKNDVSTLLMLHIGELSYDVQTPISEEKLNMCKKLLLDVLSNICDAANRIKKAHGITLGMDFDIELPTYESRANSKPLKSPRDGKHKKRHSAHLAHRDITPPPSPPSPTGTQKLGRLVRGIKNAKKSQYEKRVKPIMYLKYLEKLNIATYLALRDMLDTLQSYLSDY